MNERDEMIISASDLPGLDNVVRLVQEAISREAELHPHLDGALLSVDVMYVVGSIGADVGRSGSDLDLVVMVSYRGDVSGDFDWLEYVQADIEPVLKQMRHTLAAPLPSEIKYVDPKVGDQFDCEHFVYEMTRHGNYETVYDALNGGYIDAARF